MHQHTGAEHSSLFKIHFSTSLTDLNTKKLSFYEKKKVKVKFFIPQLVSDCRTYATPTQAHIRRIMRSEITSNHLETQTLFFTSSETQI